MTCIPPDLPIDISQPIYRVTFTTATGRLDTMLVNAPTEDEAVSLVPSGIAAKRFTPSGRRYIPEPVQVKPRSQTWWRPPGLAPERC